LPGFFFGLRLRGIFAALELNHHGTADDSDRMCYAIKALSETGLVSTEWNIASGAFYTDHLTIHRYRL
jgi:hypothetical protein